MNKVIIRIAVEKGYQIVGVIGHHNIGDDDGTVVGIQKIGVKISGEEEADDLIKYLDLIRAYWLQSEQ